MTWFVVGGIPEYILKLIFKAIALGNNTLGEICSYTGLDKSMVSKYLEVLNRLYILKEEIPVTASLKFKKKTLFHFRPLLQFLVQVRLSQQD